MSDLLPAAQAAARALDEKFGKDISLLEVGRISTIADYFIIATGGNANQITAMQDAAQETLHKHSVALRHTEGHKAANWVLLDFGSIVVHIFDEESRTFYNLERIWGDGLAVEY